MGGADGSTDLPVSLTIELVSLDEDGACGLGGGEDDHIGRDTLLGVNLQHITHADVF